MRSECLTPTSKAEVLRWNIEQIALQGANAAWVTDLRASITKDSLTFAAKFW